MNIAIDARAFWWTGIGRYIRNIVREFQKNPQGHTFTLLVPEGREQEVASELADLGQSKPRQNGGQASGFAYVGVEPSYYSFKEQTRFLYQLHKLNVDLVHFTHFNVPLLYKKPYVVTIHDITRFIFPGQKQQSLLSQIAYETVFAHAVRRARSVIAVSNTTAEEIKRLPIHVGGDIATIYEGVDPEFLAPVSAIAKQKARLLLGTDKPYLLYVGVWMSHKNLMRLLDAFQMISHEYPDLKLVITGKPVPAYSNVIQYIREQNLESRVVFPGFVPQPLLSAIYSLARALVFPSLYEGFGLPPLEAAACGLPVITSLASSIPELLRDAAEYVNPESTEDIARGIRKVIDDDLYAQLLTVRGIQNAATYRWDTAATAHIRLYENALQ